MSHTKKFEQGTRNSFTITRANLDSLNFTVYSSTGGSTENLDKIRVLVVLNRDGKKITMCNGNLRAIHMHSTFFKSNFEFAWPWAYNIQDDNPGGTNPNRQNYLPLKYDFGGMLNLDGSDELYIEVDAEETAWDTVDNRNYIIMTAQNTVGVEIATPTLNIITIEPGTSEKSIPLGDNVTRITMLRTDRGIELGGLTPPEDNDLLNQDEKKRRVYIQQIVMDADKIDNTINYDVLMSKKHECFQSQSDTMKRKYQYLIHDGSVELDEVNLNCKFNPENVATGNIHIAYYQFEPSLKTLQKASDMMEKHAEIAQSKIPTV